MTLVAALITTTGIFLAVDSATSDLIGGRSVGSVVKIAATGRQSGAAINGHLEWGADVRADFHGEFLRTAALLDSRGSVSVREQGDLFGRSLVAEAQRNAKPGLERFLKPGPIVTITIAGFDKDQPTIHSVSLHWTPPLTAQEPPTFSAAASPPAGCGWLAGNNAVAVALLRNSVGNEPSAENMSLLRKRPEVQSVRAAMVKPCEGLTNRNAGRFFQLAVRATIEYGEAFGIARHLVGPPIRVLEISRTSIKSRTLDAPAIARRLKPAQK